MLFTGPHLPGSKPVSVMPMLLRFSPSDPRRLVAVFDHQHFCNDCSFKLEVDATKFADKGIKYIVCEIVRCLFLNAPYLSYVVP